MSPDMTTYAIDDQQIHDYRKDLSPIQEVIIDNKELSPVPEVLIDNKEYRKILHDNAINIENKTQFY
jgi:hypothetical protein